MWSLCLAHWVFYEPQRRYRGCHTNLGTIFPQQRNHQKPAKSISTYVLASSMTTSPRLIMNYIRYRLVHSSLSDHQAFDIQPENALFINYCRFDDYIGAHEQIGIWIIRANFPCIIHDQRTVEYILHGLHTHPGLTPSVTLPHIHLWW